MLLRAAASEATAGVFLILWIGCAPDAPHDNPLDPQSPSFRDAAAVTGTITTLYAPYNPIKGGLVVSLPEGNAGVSDENGVFHLLDLTSGVHTLVAGKAGYSSDTVSVTIVPGKPKQVDFHLDALPVSSDIAAISNHISQWWPGPVYEAEIAASVSDADGASDIASVSVNIDTLVRAMSFSPADRMFHASIKSEELPGGTLQWLVGKPVLIKARDNPGNSSSSQPVFITRIIEETPVAVFPSSLDSATARPTLAWSQLYLPYPFTYEVRVIRVDAGLQTEVWSRSGITNSVSTMGVDQSLATGSYYWTVAVVDEYGNRSRSKEASFIVP